MLETAPEYQLPEPPALMSAKTYKTRFVDALVERLKKLAKTLLARYFEVLNDYFRVNANNGKLYRENENLRADNAWLSQKNDRLEEVKMMKKYTFDEQNGLWYEQCGEY